jgi:hypothetical protein
VGVVAGSTYLEARTLYQRAFALFWFFPLRDNGTGVVRAETFLSNNVAFRREVILAHPFRHSQSYRAQSLPGELRRGGYQIYRASAARAEHPAPNGIRHFVARALGTGYDHYLHVNDLLPARPAPHVGGLANVRQKLSRRFGNIWKRRREVHLSAWEVPLAAVLAAAFFGLAALGLAASRVNQAWLRRRLIGAPDAGRQGT